MVDQEVSANQLKADRFPFQSEGDITLAVRNANYMLGPVMLHIVMKPNASIPAHLHTPNPLHNPTAANQSAPRRSKRRTSFGSWTNAAKMSTADETV